MIEITGKVIHGDSYGRVLGFPTANLDRRQYLKRNMKVKFGVWAGWALIPSGRYKAGITIGPLDKRGLPKLEAHLIGFSGNLYGKLITIVLTKYLRPWKNFKSEQSLKQQLARDIEKINKIIHI